MRVMNATLHLISQMKCAMTTELTLATAEIVASRQPHDTGLCRCRAKLSGSRFDPRYGSQGAAGLNWAHVITTKL